MTNSDFTALGIALGLGLLVGLQKEWNRSRIAGVRTFTLITLFGSVTGMIARQFDEGWLIAIGGLSVAWLLGIANFLKKGDKRPDIGQTTEIAALLMFGVGAYLVFGNYLVGVVIGGLVALLLYLKEYLSDIIARLGEKDLRAIMLFAAISLVILPVLPDRNFGPFEVLNLQEIWLMVVLIVGISITGYFAYKWFGNDMGTSLSGILGGLISSTATTVTFSRRAKETLSLTKLSGFVIMVASTVAFLRVILEVAVVAPRQFEIVAPPLLVVTFFMALISAGLFYYNKKEDENDPPEAKNPAQFKTALVFAVLYAVILLAVAFVKDEFGEAGLYLVAIVSGLTDMDAITLSLSNMMKAGRIEPTFGWHLILLAALSNLVFKGAIAGVLGGKKLLRIIAPTFGLTLVVGALVWWLWGG